MTLTMPIFSFNVVLLLLILAFVIINIQEKLAKKAK